MPFFTVTWVIAAAFAVGPASQPVAASVASGLSVGSGLNRTVYVSPLYADGAPPGFSGGFGESACDACHFDAAVNTKPGQLTLGGVPERFVAGERYPITITLTRPGMVIGGFQLTSRVENGGAQAGMLAPGPGDEKRIKIDGGTVQYANQREAGTVLVEPATAKWTVVWTAPTTGGTVVFHAAGNASDKDGASRGDFVYTTVATTRSQ